MSGRAIRLKLRGDLYGVVDAFRQLPARQLVVLGEPGAGKTVFALLLALDLLDVREPGEPTPVLLPLSSWNPPAEHLYTWMARRLLEEYPALANTRAYGPDAATRLIHDGRVVPVLDGLDEMPPALREAALEALDRALANAGPFVVTCRTNEYQSAVAAGGRVLSRAAVVEIEPVDVAGAIEFLSAAQTDGDTRWQPVFGQLRAHPDGPLAAALSTPLMVYLARTAYAHPTTDPAQLCDPDRFTDRASVEAHLLEAYLPSVYRDDPAPQLTPESSLAVSARWYPAERARRWLAFIATHVAERGTHDLAWWEFHTALPRWPMRLAGASVLGLVDGLSSGIGLAIGMGAGGFAAGLAGGLAARLIGGLMEGPPPHPAQFNAQLRGRRRQFGQGITHGILVGLAIGIGVGVVIGVINGAAQGISAGAVIGGTMWLLGGLTWWMNTPAEAIRLLSPTSLLGNDRTVSGLQLLFSNVGVPAVAGLATAMVGIAMDVPTGLVVGLAAGLLAGLVNGSRSRFGPRRSSAWVTGAWGWYLIAQWWLALTGRLPWRPMAFLHDAHQRGVLRQTGPVYQFRHALLQDHLAKRAADQ